VLSHSQSVITVPVTSWKISEAENIPKLRRLYRNKPACVLKEVEREQNKRLEQEIIERIEGTPTSWVSPV
jgi:DNA-binding transcriptional regulator YbjK